MSSSKVERKLAAIMFTDIAGYTEQMSKDQDVAFVLLEEKQSKFKPLIKEHNGTLIKEMGDGTLSQYPTAVDASKCSVELQKLIKDNDKLNVRVGIHLGDTLFKDGDVFGDGVNIASRLESMSPAGGILVSKNVYDELLSRQGFEGVSLGMQSLKGVGRLVEVYALKDTHLTVPNPDDYTDTKVEVHSDDEVPSIAIIPFDNKGADEDVFYAYGISADLISDCSGAGLIRVASLKDVEKLDYSNMETSDLSEKLLTRYIAQGTLWKMGEMFQLSVELYDTKDKKVVWSDRWQEKWDNLPNIKTSLSDGLLKALDTKSKVEQKVDTTNPEAYEFYLKAKHKYEKRQNTDDTEIARGLLQKAIDLDDNLIVAKDLLGNTYQHMGNYDEAMEIYISALKQAEDLGDKSGIGNMLNSIGVIKGIENELDSALDYFTRSLAIREELGDKSGMGTSLMNIGLVYANKGDYNKALDYYGRSLVICEELGDKSGMGYNLVNIGDVHFRKGDYEKALDYYNRALSIAEELGNKLGMGTSLNNIGLVHHNKGDLDTALDYYNRSLAICEELGDKRGMANRLVNIGTIYENKDSYEKALDHFKRSLAIQEELGNKHGMGYSLMGIGNVHADKGDYDKALDYYERSLAIQEELGNKHNMVYSLNSIGGAHYYKGEYNKAIEYLEKSLAIKKAIGVGADDLIWVTTYLYLTYKQLGKDYDVNEIHSLIKETENIKFELNFRLYQLLEESSYLETAYNQVQEKASAMEKELAEKYLSYPIPKQIVESWEKVSKVKN